MDNILENIGISKLSNIPNDAKKLFIDVGTSIDAPNSASWLINHDDAFVVGIEPNPENIEVLKKGRTANVTFPYLRLNDDSVMLNNNIASKINERFCMLKTAIDNVDNPTTANFYLSDERNTGCSSLLKPTKKLGLDVKEVYQTPVISLKQILSNLIPNRFSHVTFLKTDAQGKDLDVVKSCKEYLKNVLVIQMEVFTDGAYENEQQLEDIEQFMFSNNFTTLGGSLYDRIYINKELSTKVEVPKINFIET